MVFGLAAAGTLFPVLSTENCRSIVVDTPCLKREDDVSKTLDMLISIEVNQKINL